MTEVVDALAGCAKWAIDLLSWIADSLFCLMKDPEFLSLLTPQTFHEMTAYLQSRNDVALHLLLCSSTRGFIAAACRCLLQLDTLSKRAIQYYQNKAAQNGGANKSPMELYQAYLKMHQHTSTGLIRVTDMDKLVSALGADIRSAYQVPLAGLAAKAASPPPAAPNSNGNIQQQQGEAAVKRAQLVSELNMLMMQSPPGSFLPVLKKLFGPVLTAFRTTTDPALLYFADFSLLEVEDTPKCLAARRASGRYVDLFKRVMLTRPSAAEGLGEDGQSGATGGVGGGSGTAWRRCVRCAAVMEDVYPSRPGFNYVLTQQRKCACGGNWGLLSKGSLTG